MAIEIVPSIDLRGGRVVRLRQGDFARQLDYAADPIETAKGFAEAGARWLHIVDLDGAKVGRPVQAELIGRVIAGAGGMSVQVGGGVRSRDDVLGLIAAGAQRVVVGTRAIEDWEWFEALAREAQFADRLVLAVDAKEGHVAVRGWTQTSELTAIDVARRAEGLPLAGLLYTDVATDGMLTGPNFLATEALARGTRLPVIASGGVGTLEHIRMLARLPIWGVVIGRSLYEGRFEIGDALAAVRGG